MKKFILCAALPAILFFLPVLSSAHVPNVLNLGYWGGEDNLTGLSGIVSCTAPITVQKPEGQTLRPILTQDTKACKSVCDLIHTLTHLIAFGISLALYAATPILFAWGGILILISAGNPGKISEGKKILTGTLFGILITLSAYTIVKTLIVDVLHIEEYIPLAFDCIVNPPPRP